MAMVIAALTMLLITATSEASVNRIQRVCRHAPAERLCAIHHHRRSANRLRTLDGRSELPYRWAAERYPGRRDYILTRWTAIDRATRAAPWRVGSWYTAALCVHHYEGAWNAYNPAGYYGGMQFDLSTWRSNGGTGRPDLEPPAHQLRIAYRTWRARGWWPWPNTARVCGLL